MKTILYIFSFLYACVLFANNIERVSLSSLGVEGNAHSSSVPGISSDGRYVVFSSSADNLVSDDTNNADDVFLYDRELDLIKRISISDNSEEGNSWSRNPAISADGRYIAFNSQANNLSLDDNNTNWDTFLYDRINEEIKIISIGHDGSPANTTIGDARLYPPSLSCDGKLLAYASDASNLIDNDTNGKYDIFVYNRETEMTIRISTSSDGTEANAGSYQCSISADGKYVAFNSDAYNLVLNDTNNTWDTFVKELETAKTQRVSVSSKGIQANAESICIPFISSTGRYVTFSSKASNLVENDTNRTSDIFLYDTVNEKTTCISVDSSGIPGNASSHNSSISADGRFIVFASASKNLTDDSTNIPNNIFMRDRILKMTQLISKTLGEGCNCVSNTPVIAASGDFLTFKSVASNLVENDNNSKYDIFVSNVISDSLDVNLSIFANPADAGEVNALESIENINAGDLVTVTASASANHHFTKWTGTINIIITDPTSPTTTVMLSGNATLTANFEADTAMLTSLVSPAEGGTVNLQNITTIELGKTINVSAVPSENYSFKRWTSVGDVEISDVYSAETTINVYTDATIAAIFVTETNLLTVRVFPENTGTVLPSDLSSARMGDIVNISAKPIENYHFSSWNVEGSIEVLSKTSADTDITIKGDGILTANFAVNTALLTFQVTPIDSGFVQPAYTQQEVSVLAPITIKATPANDYYFVKWTISGNAIISNSYLSETRVTVKENTIITAEFASNSSPSNIFLTNYYVPENEFGAAVGKLYASDFDSEDSHIFTIVEDVYALFEIGNLNDLKLKDSESVSFDNNTSFNLTISVEDTHAFVYEKTLTVYVDNTIRFAAKKGWNLLGMPFNISSEITPSDFFEASDGQSLFAGSIWMWDKNAKKLTKSVNALSAKKGFWLFSKKDGISKILKGITDYNQEVVLKKGWNLISPIKTTLLGEHPFPELSIWAWDGQTYFDVSKAYPNALWHTPRYLIEGHGYWIHSYADTILFNN
ncbi:MAG: hypothetical protein U9O87_06170 [Verrucomicrobiota bacterium]|nr:hypothetical protein [Verrucomicrobiota bacterium]